MNTNMFEVATRNKFRFPFKGLISVEDLWELSVDNLAAKKDAELQNMSIEELEKMLIQ